LRESSRSKRDQNLTCSGIIEFKDVFVPDKNKLAKADSFETGLNKCLMESRLTITFIFVGAMAGAYEAAYKYAMQRVQFGKPIAGFQMTQQKLVRMLGDIEACLTLLVKTTQNYMAGKATMG
jgi:alkylation response protein AidB-like acyl-CoA dehydrogenase